MFALSKRSRRALPIAGPLAVVLVIATWVAGLVLGFALVYSRVYPQEFRTSAGGVPASAPHLATMLYFSFETLITLGYGDLVPQTVMTRGLSTVQALVGFGLLTASVSSIVLFYPALARMRRLARGVSHIIYAEHVSGVRLADSDVTLTGLARDVAQARIDLVHFPVIYYFASQDPAGSVARWTFDLMRFAGEARSCTRPPQVRLAGAMLDGALDDLALLLRERFLPASDHDRRRIFEAFARDHLIDAAPARPA